MHSSLSKQESCLRSRVLRVNRQANLHLTTSKGWNQQACNIPSVWQDGSMFAFLDNPPAECWIFVRRPLGPLVSLWSRCLWKGFPVQGVLLHLISWLFWCTICSSGGSAPWSCMANTSPCHIPCSIYSKSKVFWVPVCELFCNPQNQATCLLSAVSKLIIQFLLEYFFLQTDKKVQILPSRCNTPINPISLQVVKFLRQVLAVCLESLTASHNAKPMWTLTCGISYIWFTSQKLLL